MLSKQQRGLLQEVPAKKRLRVAMALLGLNQSELAELSRLAQPTICRVLAHPSKGVALSTAAALARALGCSISELFPDATKGVAA